jgi:hypothetical protein
VNGVCGVVFFCWTRCWTAGEVIPDWTGMRRSVGAQVDSFCGQGGRRDDRHLAAVELARSHGPLAVIERGK